MLNRDISIKAQVLRIDHRKGIGEAITPLGEIVFLNAVFMHGLDFFHAKKGKKININITRNKKGNLLAVD